jgi:two-component system response regulator YesN
MYKLLIVDDEPLVVDGLCTIIQDVEMQGIEIYTAYSARQAIEALAKTKIDIIISDIVMPGMSGLELQTHVKKQWPRCKFIFLTGHSNFDYVQQAMKNDGIDYILKNGHENNIGKALRKAINKIEEESRVNDLLEKAYYIKMQALTGIRRDLILDILSGDETVLEGIGEQFDKYQVDLDSSSRVHIFLINMDTWGEFNTYSDKNTARFAVKNIIEEFLAPLAKVFVTDVDEQKMIGFVQPADKASNGENIEEIEKRIRLYVNETFSDIQKCIARSLGITVSIAIANSFVNWSLTGSKYLTLKFLLNSSTDLENGRIIIEKPEAGRNETLGMPMSSILQAVKEIVTQMDGSMELAQEKEFFDLLNKLKNLRDSYTEDKTYIDNVVYCSILAVLMRNMGIIYERYGIPCSMDLSGKMFLSQHSSWSAAMDYLSGVAQTIFRGRRDFTFEYNKKLVIEIQKYINRNISDNVSLTALSNEFCYNSSYLSRLYKNITGEGLSEYINRVRIENAKTLLKNQELKISVITDLIGFKTPSYFTRFFKKATGYTPQEYRNMINV